MLFQVSLTSQYSPMLHLLFIDVTIMNINFFSSYLVVNFGRSSVVDGKEQIAEQDGWRLGTHHSLAKMTQENDRKLIFPRLRCASVNRRVV